MTSETQKAWEGHYGKACNPSYRIVAPGRVNIIGEHIDHQNYSVLPCAIDKAIHAIVYKASGKGGLSIAHLDSNKYPSVTFDKLTDIKIDKHLWYNYVVAAYLGTVEYFGSAKQDPNNVGVHLKASSGLSCEEMSLSSSNPLSPLNFNFKLMFFGDIPLAAGLSSSSALVVCSVLAFDAVPRNDAPVLCANAERYVGTAGGGMDQAAICLSEAGMAQHIGFCPLVHEPVRLPKELTLVVANTCREAPKARDMAKMYNKRVFELKTACYQLIKSKDPNKADTITGPELIATGLREVCNVILGTTERELASRLPDLLEDKALSKSDIDKIIPSHLRDYLLEQRCGVAVWEQNDEFYLYKRVKHVLEETLRVSTFVDLCKQYCTNENAQTPYRVLEQLGALMNGSQASLRLDFDCSCPELNDLTDIAISAGALGSRLTGAGWGGCTVSLVPNDKVDIVIQTIKDRYFKPIWNKQKSVNPPLEHLPAENEIANALFASTPGPSARKETQNIFIDL